ncbi:hypothetical protein FRB95_011013 [Tulasnella sp. JGI-2019a]|nr:hypothetical protein FRB95_011013 [Tulasnella sp. JGI-2019a]
MSAMLASAYQTHPVSFQDIFTGQQEHEQVPNDAEEDADQPDLQTFFVRAIYDYQSSDASSLSFQRGALIEVLTQLESGWWDGLLGDERGWFPSNYVEPVSDEEAEQELASRDAAAAATETTEPAPATNEVVASASYHPWQPPTPNWPQDDQQLQGQQEFNGAGGEHSAARADDYWMPQVTGGGQIFFVNNRTGEQASEIPTGIIDAVQEAPEFALPSQVSSYPPSSNANRSRSDTFATATSLATSASIVTPTPGSSAGFNNPTPLKDDDVPAPWVKRMIDDGIAYFWYNQETGQVRWSAPSPVLGGKHAARLPTVVDSEESDWSSHDAYASSREPLTDHESSHKDTRHFSMHSNDSHVLEGSSAADRLHSTESSNGSPERADLAGLHTSENDHESTSQPTSTASAELHSAESLARQLQSQLLPRAPESIDSLSNSAREAISAVVDAVGESLNEQATPSPPQLTQMAVRVAAVVTAVRNLLYVSGTFTTPVSTSIHLSRHVGGAGSGAGSSNAFEEAVESGSRTPLMELKPFQRKVTATLSKLVLSARAADSNRDWPTFVDDAAATTRVDNDAAELERAVMSFVMEVKRIEVVGGIVLNEKRLKGALASGEGLIGVGTTVLGGGAAGSWKGFGFAPLDPTEAGVVAPQWNLGLSVIKDLQTHKALLDEGVDDLCRGAGEHATVEQVIPRVRHILANVHAFLSVAEDVDIARNVDIDGARIEQLTNQADPAIVEAYSAQVQLAKTLIRKLEADKQTVYDDATHLWHCTQSAFADFISCPPKLLRGVGMSLSRRWEDHIQRLNAVALNLKNAILDTLDGYQALYVVGTEQAEGVNRHNATNTGTQKTSNVIRRHISAPPGFGLKPGFSPADSTDSHLNMTLGGVDEDDDDDDDDEEYEDEDDDIVGMGFALGKGKSRPPPPTATVLLQPPTPGYRGDAVAPMKGGKWLALEPLSGSPSSAMMESPTSVSKDGDGASTIRQSVDGQETLRDEEYGEEDDIGDLEEEELELNGHPVRKPTLKSPSRAAKIAKIFGDEAPANYIASHHAMQSAWYLKNESDDKEILINPDGGVRGGTLRALVERLTLHTHRDAVFIDTFLITFKSFTTVDELFDMLVDRFNIPEPQGLTAEERTEWVNKKLTPIRFRVINILRSLVMDNHVLEKEDMYIMRRIHDFASRVKHVAPPAQQLMLMVERANAGGDRAMRPTELTNPPPSLMPKTKVPKLLDIEPLELARQLTILESRLFMMIRPMECLARAKEQPGEEDSIRRIIGTSNKIASWVADSVLSLSDPKRRSLIIKHFIMVAERCRDLNNFSTMAALIAGLNSPPIRRLKRSWEPLTARTHAQLDDVENTLDSGKNFTGYRQILASVNPPCIPFLGVYLTVLTFIQDGNKDLLVKEGNLINFGKRQKAAEVIREIKKYQSKPYNLFEIPTIQNFLETSLGALENAPDFWEISMRLEPREREDEKMARLLQESGFL